MFTIILSDGTRLENVEKNGDNFISKTEITSEMFENNISPVTIIENIDNETYTENHEHMSLDQLIQENGEWWFVLRDLTNRELKDLKFRADIDYIAMMTDVEIDSEV